MKRKTLLDEIRINQRYAHFYSSEFSSLDRRQTGKSVPKINRKSILTNDLLQKLKRGTDSIMSSLLPPNCRYIEKVNDGHILVIEEPPAFRTINLRMSMKKEMKKLESKGLLEQYGYDQYFDEDNPNKSFTLAVPFCIFILYIDNSYKLRCGQIYFRVSRITGLGDYLMKAPFTNISENQYICFGETAYRRSDSLMRAVDHSISIFWSAQFNTDYTYNYSDYQNTAGVNSFMEWHALSKIDPMFIYKVDWIKVPMNIADAVDEMKRQQKLQSDRNFNYSNLASLFSSPLDSGKDVRVTKYSRRSIRLFYDIAEGIYLDDKFFTHVGDELKIKHGKQTCFLNSIIGDPSSGDVRHIRLEREDGRLIVYKYTHAFKQYLLNEIKRLRYETTGFLKNGVEIKENDIIIIDNPDGSISYKQLSYIRKTPEGLHEGKIGDSFYILENTTGTLFDTENPLMNGISLKKDEVYILKHYKRGAHPGVPLFRGSFVKFDKVSVTKYGYLSMQFENVDSNSGSRTYEVKLDNGSSSSNNKLFRLCDCKPIPNIFRVGRQLFVNLGKPSRLPNEITYGTPDGIVYESMYGGLQHPLVNDIKKYVFKDDKVVFPGFDFDIEFSIGDKVVVSDWENPMNMLSVKTIQGFDNSDGNVTFKLLDKAGNIIEKKYYDVKKGILYVGQIRKITNVFEKLTAGTKIQARVAGITHFPKKDVNIIIGFITDTGGPEPLVLCSNCCTLWYSDVVEKFKKISMKSKKWKDLPHASIDISKIKYQPGDIIQRIGELSNEFGWLVMKVYASRGTKVMDIGRFSETADHFTLDKYLTVNTRLDCIPNPRIAVKAQSEGEIIPAWPNLHGYFFTCNYSELRFVNDERSVINV